MSEARLAEIRERWRGAELWSLWDAWSYGDGDDFLYAGRIGPVSGGGLSAGTVDIHGPREDLERAAHAPADIAYLLDRVERLKRLERVQEAVVDDVVRAVVRALETAAEAP